METKNNLGKWTFRVTFIRTDGYEEVTNTAHYTKTAAINAAMEVVTNKPRITGCRVEWWGYEERYELIADIDICGILPH